MNILSKSIMMSNKLNKKPKKNYMHLFREASRLESFKTWPFDEKANCSREKLAEAGFHWTGTADGLDKVRCFLCFRTLGEWSATDRPWVEHLKHSPKCYFAKLQRTEAFLTANERNIIKKLLKINCGLYERGISEFPIVHSDEFMNKIIGSENAESLFESNIPRSSGQCNNGLSMHESGEGFLETSGDQSIKKRTHRTECCCKCEKYDGLINSCLEKIADVKQLVMDSDKAVKEFMDRFNGNHNHDGTELNTQPGRPTQGKNKLISNEQSFDRTACGNSSCGCERNGGIIKGSLVKIADVEKLALGNNKIIAEHSNAINSAQRIVDEQISKALAPFHQHNEMMIDFANMINECMIGIEERNKCNEALLNDILENAGVERVRVNNEIRTIRESLPVINDSAGQVPRLNIADNDISNNIGAMNMQIHKLSAYIIQHERRINEIQREYAKICDKIGSNGQSFDTSPIDDEVLNFLVKSNNRIDKNANAVFCFAKKIGVSEFDMYKEFVKFGEVVKLTKSPKRRFGFVTFKTHAEAANAVEKHNKELFDCHHAGENGHVRSQPAPSENTTIVCSINDPNASIKNVSLFKSFSEFGDIREVHIVSRRKRAIIQYSNHESAKAAIDHEHVKFACSWDNKDRSVNAPTDRHSANRNMGNMRQSNHGPYNHRNPVLNNHRYTYSANKGHSHRASSHQHRDKRTGRFQPQLSGQHEEAINARLFKIAGYGNVDRASHGQSRPPGESNYF